MNPKILIVHVDHVTACIQAVNTDKWKAMLSMNEMPSPDLKATSEMHVLVCCT